MSLFIRNCREVTRLVLERQERGLRPIERVAVRLHLGICEMCTRFSSQLDLMNRALSRWKAYADSGDEPGDDGPR